jgi:hypothetical protein
VEPEQCPCCGYYTLEPRHDWDICPVCFCEDGDTDLHSLGDPSPYNHELTLRKARANFLLIGACEPKMLEYVCTAEQRARYRHEPRTIT